MSQALETFGWNVITELGVFQVDFSQTTTQLVNRNGKNGSYTTTEYSIVVKSAKFTNPMLITKVKEKDYERMRLLRLSGLINLTVTRGIAPLGQPSYLAPYIITGSA